MNQESYYWDSNEEELKKLEVDAEQGEKIKSNLDLESEDARPVEVVEYAKLVGGETKQAFKEEKE